MFSRLITLLALSLLSVGVHAADATPIAAPIATLKVGYVYATFATYDTCGLQILSVDPQNGVVTLKGVNNPYTQVLCEASAEIIALRCAKATCWRSEVQTSNGIALYVDMNGNFKLFNGWCDSKTLQCWYSSGFDTSFRDFMATPYTSNPPPLVFRASLVLSCDLSGTADEVAAEEKRAMKAGEDSALLKCSQFAKNCRIDRAQSSLKTSSFYAKCYVEATAIAY